MLIVLTGPSVTIDTCRWRLKKNDGAIIGKINPSPTMSLLLSKCCWTLFDSRVYLPGTTRQPGVDR